MRLISAFCLLAAMLTAEYAFCDNQPQALTPCAPGGPETASCAPSKKDLKQAQQAYKRGVHLLQDQKEEEALLSFTQAMQLSPRNIEYATAVAITQQHLVYRDIQKGNQALLQNQTLQAEVAFHDALHLDPQNEFARQRMSDLLGDAAPRTQGPAELVAESDEIVVVPDPTHQSFHFKGDSRALFEQIAKAYGVSAQLDESVQSRHVWFDIDDVDFFTAMKAAGNITKTFWSPLGDKQVLVAADNVENHRQFDRMAMRTFYFPGYLEVGDLNDLTNSLRTVFDIRFASQEIPAGTIIIRAPQNVVKAATEYIEQLDNSRPQVMLDIEVYQISHSLIREIGMHIPNNFNLYNIPAAALAGLTGQSLQSLINQLQTGGLNAANAGGLQALLAQLQSGQGIFSQPLATFGGGLTFSGISLDHLTAALSLNQSSVRDIQHATLRAGNNTDAVFKIGERFPILTASFSTAVTSPQISQLLGASAGTGASSTPGLGTFPSFNYEDIGLNLKAKPYVFSDSSLALSLELSLRTIGTQSVNGVPVISNREYKGSIVLDDGEPAVVAGAVSHTEQMSMNGIPGLGAVPLLNKAMVDNNKTTEDDELLIVITPHVINSPARKPTPVIWMAQ